MLWWSKSGPLSLKVSGCESRRVWVGIVDYQRVGGCIVRERELSTCNCFGTEFKRCLVRKVGYGTELILAPRLLRQMRARTGAPFLRIFSREIAAYEGDSLNEKC